MRDRLIELIKKKSCFYQDCIGKCGECSNVGLDGDDIETLADHLLANGVIVPPCKVGNKLYYIAYRSNDGKTEKYIKEETVEMISIDSRSIYAHIPRALLIDLADLGKTVFLTKELAEKALAERSGK